MSHAGGFGGTAVLCDGGDCSFSVGLAALLLHPNLIKKIIGLNLMDTAVFLFLAAMGYVDGGKAPMVEPGAEAAAYINPVPGGWCSPDRGGGEHHGPVFWR